MWLPSTRRSPTHSPYTLVPAVVTRWAQVESGRARSRDGEGTFGAVTVDQGDGAVGEAPVVVAEIKVLLDGDESVRRTVGVLLFCLATGLAEAVTPLLLVEHEQRIGRPILTRQCHGQPRHEHLVDPVPASPGQSGDRLADTGAQAPRVVADGDPLVGCDLGALTVHLDPPRRHPDLVVPQHIVSHPVAVGAPIR